MIRNDNYAIDAYHFILSRRSLLLLLLLMLHHKFSNFTHFSVFFFITVGGSK
jgi:hypothetical protein